MKHTRIVVTHYGGPESLQVLEEECPEPKPGQVRVRMLAAGVGMPDIMAREGVHPGTPRVPYTPGWDLVGEVEKLGNGVSGLEPGQIVAAMPIHGAYAEFSCLPQSELVRVPCGLDAAKAVSLIEQQRIQPLIAQRFPLAEARRAQELLGKGGVIGKVVLVRKGPSLEPGAA